jgi:hypothetical protein
MDRYSLSNINNSVRAITTNKRQFAVKLRDTFLIICPPHAIGAIEGQEQLPVLNCQFLAGRLGFAAVGAIGGQEQLPVIYHQLLTGGPRIFLGVRATQHIWQPPWPCQQQQK